MNPNNWISLLGKFQIDDGTLTFKGGVTSYEGKPASQVGNFLCEQEFGGGTISSTIRFHDDPSSAGAGLILFYHPASKGFVVAHLGGMGFLVEVRTFTSQKWITHDSYGPGDQIEAEKDYDFRVHVAGSRVVVTLDGIRVVDTTLQFPLPRGQTGLWAIGNHDISFSNFKVEPEHPKLFVVMQFSDPFDELYADVIKPVGEKLDFNVVRADETYGPGLIIADIERNIVEAKVVVADITPNNPNVYWEAGYAHALRKPTILIAERDTKLPFDVSPFRTLFYDNTIAGKSMMEEGLENHLLAIQREWGAG